MSKVKIPVAAPLITGKELEYVKECINSGWISSQSNYVNEFESRFANFCQCEYGVTTNSGTTALHLALSTLNIGSSDEVIIPTFTMIATPNSVMYTGAKPVLVDSEVNHWNIDVNKIEKQITKKTKAIMLVHTYGHPVDMDPILELAKDYNLYVIEDAAEAHGAEYKGKKIGSFGHISCFSFYANKIITTGEGGILVTQDKELAERAKWLRAHAFGKDGKHFHHEELGFGYRMSALQAAFGLGQLDSIENFVDGRRNNAKLYKDLLNNLSLSNKLILQSEASWAKNVYWMFSILTTDSTPISRNQLMDKLASDGIETRTFFYPIHTQPTYSNLTKTHNFPISEYLSKSGINLPSGNNLTVKDIEYVCDKIKNYMK